MPAERLKLFAMRISRRAGIVALWFGLALGLSAQAPANDTKFVSSEAALEQGLGAYKAGYYNLAVPALAFAAGSGLFFGQYYLAQIYADNGTAFTNHAKAYELYMRVVDEHANVDPDDDWRAAYVGKSLTAVARYTLRGLPEIGLVPNTERAAKFLRDAATFFGDSDAQFELARMYLKGEGVQEDRKLAFHWLSTLTQKGHAGAQAFLAELLWKGNELARDEKRALALITVAVANAPEADRLWIEDIYQNIFCGSSTGRAHRRTVWWRCGSASIRPELGRKAASVSLDRVRAPAATVRHCRCRSATVARRTRNRVRNGAVLLVRGSSACARSAHRSVRVSFRSGAAPTVQLAVHADWPSAAL